ncbi:hypothetical protein [Carnobacterium viridans]|uniref:Uncharacterized protein n=1 Tax=Carnobacterium viridans TaxID=174587 RepID=A0A1H0XIM2_9LACT|nr:hypothetical protein [Carnobacterium viridans]SDQ02763.1 hypothetical protein SAMN04487752_0288 [Carnobacterium viridans]
MYKTLPYTRLTKLKSDEIIAEFTALVYEVEDEMAAEASVTE